MTTTSTAPEPAAQTPPSAPRRLRRNRADRVGAGVAAGLADYFGVDPVLFRVLFAASAFFGGAGVIAYLVAWATIPEEGTEHAAIDSWIGRLRSRRVPPWAIAVGAGLLLWISAFSWWAPAPFGPVLLVVVVLLVIYGRRSAQSSPDASTVSLTKSPPPRAAEARARLDERRAARRERRRRAVPVRITTLIAVVVALIALAAVDAAHGIALPLYFVFVGGIAVLGVLTGLALRRTPWSVTGLIVLSLIGLAAFGSTSASLHDGLGQRNWDPVSRPAASYRLAFGQATLDLRDLDPQNAPRTVHVTMAAGQLRVLAPKSLNLTVHAYVRAGNVAVDRPLSDFGTDDGGVGYDRVIHPPKGASGPPIKVIVHLADGNVDVRRQ
ncbi:PspC domain-containing protein [uncultured Jatrophihabitans sp.]|uniref:PspC domain-containing protein n=1 Tax=uncultured Jatrophihabitans sp. TaxID=1610747 RepID=UPI0035CC3D62